MLDPLFIKQIADYLLLVFKVATTINLSPQRTSGGGNGNHSVWLPIIFDKN